jgi:hypothetical protein
MTHFPNLQCTLVLGKWGIIVHKGVYFNLSRYTYTSYTLICMEYCDNDLLQDRHLIDNNLLKY